MALSNLHHEPAEARSGSPSYPQLNVTNWAQAIVRARSFQNDCRAVPCEAGHRHLLAKAESSALRYWRCPRAGSRKSKRHFHGDERASKIGKRKRSAECRQVGLAGNRRAGAQCGRSAYIFTVRTSRSYPRRRFPFSHVR